MNVGQLVIFGLFLLFSLSLLCYYLCIFKALLSYRQFIKTNSGLPVSIIICAKDEAGNLAKFLPEIYRQNYPEFEVVLIDDRSIDDTFDVMQDFKERFPDKTRLVKVNFNDDERLRGNKKYALTLGIKAAKYPYLLFTDADCRPASANWIQQMVQKFSDSKQLVLGYGKYQAQTGFLNKLIRFETVQTALQYVSYALKGMPYMGVGRNLAYTKDLFMENNGFYSHLDILSGDDDLFVNEVATANNTAVCLHPDSFTISKPKQSFGDFVRQKRRHIGTAQYYRFKHRLLLAWYYLSLSGFWLTAIVLLPMPYQWQIVLGIVFVRLATAWYINYKVNKQLQEFGLNFWFPLLEISLMLTQFYIFILNLFKKPVNWTK